MGRLPGRRRRARQFTGSGKGSLDRVNRTNWSHRLLQASCNKRLQHEMTQSRKENGPARLLRAPTFSPARQRRFHPSALRRELLSPGPAVPFHSFTVCELRTALAALKNLWPEDSAAKALRHQSVLFPAFRCPGDHCHLICHGTRNLCLKVEAACLLQQEMEAQEPSDADPRTTQLYLV
jgi:hypothetical protein